MLSREQFENIPNNNDGDNKDEMTVMRNMKSKTLLSKNEVGIIFKMLELDYEGNYDYWVNTEFDSNQSPMEFVFNNNHLAVKARSKTEAAVMINILSTILIFWDLNNKREYDFIKDQVSETYPDAIYPGFLAKIPKANFRDLVRVFTDNRQDNVQLLSESAPQEVVRYPKRYRDFLAFIYRRLCDQFEPLGVVTKESLRVFLERYE